MVRLQISAKGASCQLASESRSYEIATRTIIIHG